MHAEISLVYMYVRPALTAYYYEVGEGCARPLHWPSGERDFGISWTSVQSSPIMYYSPSL